MEEMYLSKEDKIYLNEEFHIIENDTKFPYMLFHSLTSDFFMSKYENDIAKINDYIFFNNQNLEKILDEKIEKLEEAKNTDIYKGYRYEGIMARESEMFEWEWVIKSLNKSNNIVLLLSFLEGALKEICNFVEREKRIKEKATIKKGDSKFKFYLKRISICCKYEIEANIRKHIQIINRAKAIRNIFVHEWDPCYNIESDHKWEKYLKEFKINELIDSVSKILYVCEYAMLKANILHKEKDLIGKGLLAERQLRIFYQIQDETESDDFNLFSEILEID